MIFRIIPPCTMLLRCNPGSVFMPKRSSFYPQYPEKKSKISFFIGKIYISMKIRDISEYLIRRKHPGPGNHGTMAELHCLRRLSPPMPDFTSTRGGISSKPRYYHYSGCMPARQKVSDL
jgi:hypothetical protein